MKFFSKPRQPAHVEQVADKADVSHDSNPDSLIAEQKVTFQAIWLGVVASIGGFMFGYVR